MNKITKLFCVLLAVIMVAVLPCEAIAVEPRASDYISSISGIIVKTTGNSFEIRFSTEGCGMVDEVGVFMIQLMKSTDQVTWYREKTFYASSYPVMMDTDTSYHSGYLTHTGPGGYYYRANIVHYASRDGGSDRIARYTNTIYIPSN